MANKLEDEYITLSFKIVDSSVIGCEFMLIFRFRIYLIHFTDGKRLLQLMMINFSIEKLHRGGVLWR